MGSVLKMAKKTKENITADIATIDAEINSKGLKIQQLQQEIQQLQIQKIKYLGQIEYIDS